MAASDQFIGWGTALSYSLDSGSTWAELENVEEVGAPGDATTDKVESTYLKSPSRKKQYVPGLTESGTFAFTQQWSPARYAFLRSKFGTKGILWKIGYPDTGVSTAVFEAYIMKLPHDPIKAAELMKIKCELQITGDVTFTAN